MTGETLESADRLVRRVRPQGGSDPGDSGRDGLKIAERREPGERLALELPDALARQVELVADRLERPRLALEPEPQLEDAPLALRERVERFPNTLPTKRLF